MLWLLLLHGAGRGVPLDARRKASTRRSSRCDPNAGNPIHHGSRSRPPLRCVCTIHCLSLSLRMSLSGRVHGIAKASSTSSRRGKRLPRGSCLRLWKCCSGIIGSCNCCWNGPCRHGNIDIGVHHALLLLLLLGILQSSAASSASNGRNGCVGTTAVVAVVVVVVVVLHADILSIIVQGGRTHVPTRIGNAVAVVITSSSIVVVVHVAVGVVAAQRGRARVGARSSRQTDITAARPQHVDIHIVLALLLLLLLGNTVMLLMLVMMMHSRVLQDLLTMHLQQILTEVGGRLRLAVAVAR
mmetsp:Transcript_22732/g.35010  ORF Transcript_22732/g.35010 Transcript_22732/m.35010 type:complete len:298 (-) Transcript_22732:715-1608(-)